ncbi:MAG: 16S rRNA (guanine(527)-N(7))-methyltransferase RsmG [Actinomycetes bacterium]
MVSRETPPLPDWLTAHQDRLSAFADLLADVGVARGLIGPREVPRLWQRHLLNCAVVADPALGYLGPDQSVADVGSGAGLPGLVWAIVRPDLKVVLIEPLLRRSTFLSEAVEQLDLGMTVTVRRDRAEDVARDPAWVGVDVVTARAVAPLDRLIGWTAPLLVPGGRLLALKGSSAQEEVDAAASALAAAGLLTVSVEQVAADYLEQPTTIINAVRRAAE